MYLQLKMSKLDQGSLIGPSTSKQAIQRDMKSRGGRGRPEHNKKSYSEVGELKQKIRLLQKELAKVNMVARPVKVVNHLGLGVPLPGVSNYSTRKGKRVSISSSTSSSMPATQKPSATPFGLKTVPAVGVEIPVRPQPEHRVLAPVSAVYRQKVYQQNRRVPYATHGSQLPTVGNDATIATARSSVSSGMSRTAIDATGKQELFQRTHKHTCNWCGKEYMHEHGGRKVDHDQQIGDCPYPKCQNHNAKKVAGNHGEPLSDPTALDVLAEVAAVAKPIRFLAPHKTQAVDSRNDDPEIVKPLKTVESVPIDTMKNKGDFLQKVRRPQRTAPHYADCDLVHLLRLEYAFKPRTASMLSQMAAKSKIYLSKYDCTELTAKQLYNMIISAVSAAMEISPLEEQVRQSLRNSEGNQARHKQARMIREGILGNKLFGAPDKLPSNK